MLGFVRSIVRVTGWYPEDRSLKFYDITARLLLLGAALGLMVPAKAQAQNVFRVRIDTITANAGDTVFVNAYYTFTTSKPHTIDHYLARFLYDASLLRIVGYATDSTASAMLFDTIGTHVGLWAHGDQEINLGNPVLFRIRVVLSSNIGDTAWLRRDRSWMMLDALTGVHSIIQQDGWIRTATATGHTVMTSPGRSISGISNGYRSDSVGFDLPITISDISKANVRSARLTFVYDSNHLSFGDASGASKTADLTSVVRSYDTVTLLFSGKEGGGVQGGDTLTVLHFVALVGIDTECLTLRDLAWRPLDSGAVTGNTTFAFDSISLFGRYGIETVDGTSAPHAIRVYPNPSSGSVVIEGLANVTLRVSDELGRCVWTGEARDGFWKIPATVPDGIYTIVVQGAAGASAMIVIER